MRAWKCKQVIDFDKSTTTVKEERNKTLQQQTTYKYHHFQVVTVICLQVSVCPREGGAWSREGVPGPRGKGCLVPGGVLPSPGGSGPGGAWWRQPPPRRLLLRAVRILLERILVLTENWNHLSSVNLIIDGSGGGGGGDRAAWPHFRSNFLQILPNNRVSAQSQRLSPPGKS